MPEMSDPEGFYVGTRLLPTVIAVNTNIVTDAPTSWQDLTDAQYAGKIAMPNPDVSGAAAYNAAVWLDNDKLGKTWLEALAKNEPLIADSNGPVLQAVADGSNPVGIVVDSLVRDLAAAGSIAGQAQHLAQLSHGQLPLCRHPVPPSRSTERRSSPPFTSRAVRCTSWPTSTSCSLYF